jgi:hypothetical protein
MPNTSSMDIVVARGRPQTRQDSPVLVDGWVRAPTAAPNRIRKSATKSANKRGRIREHHQERPEESGHSAVNGRAEFAVFAQEREEASQGCPSDAYLTRESGRPVRPKRRSTRPTMPHRLRSPTPEPTRGLDLLLDGMRPAR